MLKTADTRTILWDSALSVSSRLGRDRKQTVTVCKTHSREDC